jgi:chlorite dismutase
VTSKNSGRPAWVSEGPTEEEKAEARARREAQRAGRQFVKYSFYKLNSTFRRLPDHKQIDAKHEFIEAVQHLNQRMLLRSYSLFGLRADADFMLWQVAATLEPFQQLATAIFSTTLGAYLDLTYSYQGATRRSIYEIPEALQGHDEEDQLTVEPTDLKYLFVYPFVKTRPWYMLPMEERQEMMNEHVIAGRRYPDIKLNTIYSYGVDDQEFVVAFEGDHPTDFIDLVMELRETEASSYTLRDTPMFTCIAMDLGEVMNSLGGPTIDEAVITGIGRPAGWLEVARLEEISEGSSKLVNYGRQQVAIFNVDGKLYAVNNRCPHSRGPLCEGTVKREDGALAVTCPWHEAAFDLQSGTALYGPSSRDVAIFSVKVEDGAVFIVQNNKVETS